MAAQLGTQAGATRLSVRISGSNPNHHLWNNNGSWWLHYTVHEPDFTKQRRRLSLGTADLAEARLRRDDILKQEGRR